MLSGWLHNTVAIVAKACVPRRCVAAPGNVLLADSDDGGNTWDKETYYLSTVDTYPEYSTNCVLPPELADGKPGMILSVLGDRAHAVHMDPVGGLQAVRWRPLP